MLKIELLEPDVDGEHEQWEADGESKDDKHAQDEAQEHSKRHTKWLVVQNCPKQMDGWANLTN